MAHPARLLAATLLVAALAVPASLHASGLSGLSPAARLDNGASFSANSWSLDWLYRFVNQVWPAPARTHAAAKDSSRDIGGGLDPNGRASVRKNVSDSSPDIGGGLDPNGRAHPRVRPR
jgi:hypothetical protein